MTIDRWQCSEPVFGLDFCVNSFKNSVCFSSELAFEPTESFYNKRVFGSHKRHLKEKKTTMRMNSNCCEFLICGVPEFWLSLTILKPKNWFRSVNFKKSSSKIFLIKVRQWYNGSIFNLPLGCWKCFGKSFGKSKNWITLRSSLIFYTWKNFWKFPKSASSTLVEISFQKDHRQ